MDEGNNMRSRIFLVVILALLVLGSLATFWWYQGSSGPSGNGNEDNILLLGVDDTGPGAAQRSDTIVIAHFGKPGDPLGLLSVPRDLKVRFDGSDHKINAAYAEGGPTHIQQVLSDFLSVPLRAYVALNYQGFVKLIDLLYPDGVTVTIDRPLKYDDTKQNLHINLPAGTQRLNGAQALDYVRYRDDITGDLGRITRQQGFIKAIAQQMKKPQSLTQVKDLVQTVQPYIQTNLSLADLYQLAERLQAIGPDQVNMKTIPGKPQDIDKVSYFVADAVETGALVSEFFQGVPVVSNGGIKLIVLNGNKAPGLASTVSDRLAAQSFTIIARWNAEPYDYPESYLINLSGDSRKAQLLKAALPASVRLVIPGEFKALMEQVGVKDDRLQQIGATLRTTAVPPYNRAVDLNEADFVLILGGGFQLGN
jgi:LCP family protein required for cell wall assembly